MPTSLPLRPRSTLLTAAALALAAAISLGLARFSYAVLLPPMRSDLGWSYFTAGAMNTANAAGYLLGALLMPAGLRRFGARPVLLAGGVAVVLLLAAHGLTTSDALLFALRGLTGLASAAMFVAGGLMAAQLVGRHSTAEPSTAPSAGLVLGIYYGGAGAGIVVSALLLPPLVAAPGLHAWQSGWIALGAVAAGAIAVTAWATRGSGQAPVVITSTASIANDENELRMPWRFFAFGLTSYFLFGLGYIGTMTFGVTLLREQNVDSGTVTLYFAVLGLAAVASPWLWAGLLQRHRDGTPLARLNAVLAAATLLPVISGHALAGLASGALFGAVFLSVVASTTALVRHNLPPSLWPAGISAFTIVFAAGQIIGPSGVGWVADGAGGLRGGLALSAGVLMLAAVLASRQRAAVEA